MLRLDLGLKAKIFGLGLEVQVLGIGLAAEALKGISTTAALRCAAIVSDSPR